MSARHDVVELLRRYDDEAWAALANRGLLRRARKDLAGLEPQLVEDGPDAVAVALGGRTVRIPRVGPGQATCTCPSTTVCQHVVAAGLWLADHGATGTVGGDTGAGDTGAKDEEDLTEALHEEVMALDRDALVAGCGRATYRRAHQLVEDLVEQPRLVRARHLLVELGGPDVRIRYFGGGLAGWVLDQPVSLPDTYRVAAVLAWQRGHGRELEALPVTATARPPTRTRLAQDDSRRRLLAVVETLLTDTVRVGISHLSGSVLDRFTTASVWAQGAELPRLALLLRRIAEQVDLQLARSASAHDLVLLDDLAVAYALTVALQAGAAPHLVGRARGTYDPVRELRLLGLGALPWRSGSGHHGLTTLFWDRGRPRFLTWTDARPVGLAGFDPRARHRQPAPWPGLGSPADAAGRDVHLTRARLSGDGRISGVDTTSARVEPADPAAWRDLLAGAESSWSDLARSRAETGEALLGAPRPAADWAILRPVSSGQVVFDEARQVLGWPVHDEAGSVLWLEVAWAEHLGHAIDRIERLPRLDGSAAVLARVRVRGGALVGEPVSLLRDEAPHVDALHFDAGPADPRPGLVARLRRAGASPAVTPADQPGEEAHPRLPGPLVDLRALVEQHAQRGVAGLAPGTFAAEVARVAARLDHHGLTVFGASVAPSPAHPVDEAGLALRVHFLLQQVERVLTRG